MIEWLLPIVAAALVGSVHCAGMCGGLVAFSVAGGVTFRERAMSMVAYHVPRGVGYMLLGAAAGALGSGVDLVSGQLGYGRIAGVVAGVVLVGWGLVTLLQTCGFNRSPQKASSIVVPVARLVRKLKEKPPTLRAAVMGGCTAALPCGFLHLFTVTAAGTGSALRGALLMGAFWAGTLPALVGLGSVVQGITGRLRRHASIVASCLLVAFGIASVLGRLPFAPAAAQGGAAPAGVAPACHDH